MKSALLLACLAARLVGHQAMAATPVCPSVMMYDAFTMRAAPQLVDRVAEIHGDAAPASSRWVQFVPTIHARLNKDFRPEVYGVHRSRAASWTAPSSFEPMSEALLQRCRVEVDAAVERAVSRGLHIAVLPHLDPAGGPIVEWRNNYDFRPRADVAGYSYESLALGPIADAIERHATLETRVDFCLSGEMGEGLFRYPEEHLRVLAELRERFSANPNTAGVRLGIGLNWCDLSGRVERDNFDREAVQAFFDACDFLGFSCYTPVHNPPTPADFRAATEGFLAELTELGIELDPETPLLFTEVGLGGGDGPSTPEEIVAMPWAGRGSGPYRPWQNAELADLRRGYFEALCEYLESPSASRVERVFLWSEGPWDPQGVIDRLHREDTIAERIRRHNAQ